jgi:hypothetical protein
MSKKAISWILDFTSKLPNDEEKIKCLQANNNMAILTILKLAYDPNIKWLLPEGDAPYNPSGEANTETYLYSDARKLYLFIEGGNPNLTTARREALFIDFLQNIHPEDAKLIVAIKDKKLPYKGLNSKLVLKAFPGLY